MDYASPSSSGALELLRQNCEARAQIMGASGRNGEAIALRQLAADASRLAYDLRAFNSNYPQPR